MANRTDKEAAAIHGTNPQNLIEYISRQKIYDSVYWKQECFGLSAERLVDKAVELKEVGGMFGEPQKPTHFLCLILKMLQIQPDKDIIVEFIKNDDFKYLRLLGAFYMRLVGKAVDVYQYLEPLYNDYRKVRLHTLGGKLELTHVDELIDQMLQGERLFTVALPRLPSRLMLERAGQLEPRISVLDEEFDEAALEEEQQEQATALEQQAKQQQRGEEGELGGAAAAGGGGGGREEDGSERRREREKEREREKWQLSKEEKRRRERSRSPRDRSRSRERAGERDRRERDGGERDRRDRGYDERDRRGERGADRYERDERRDDRDRRDKYDDRRERDRHDDRRERDRDERRDRDKRDTRDGDRRRERSASPGGGGGRAGGDKRPRQAEADAAAGGGKGDEIAQANALRASLGLKPLK